MKEFTVTADYCEMSRLAADKIFSVIKNNPEAVLVLPTGGSPKLAYSLFCRRVAEEGLDLSKVTFVKLDEWMGLPMTDEATCEVFLRRELLEPLKIKEEQFIHFNSEAEDIDAECEAFRKAYSALPRIDLVILGIGKNGHLGLNEPGEKLFCGAHTISLDEKTKTHEMLTHTESAVTHGITMGMKEIFRGEEVLLLAAGGEKSHLLPCLTDDFISTELPFTLLKLHPACTCIVDGSAFGC